jgi:phage shock protein A
MSDSREIEDLQNKLNCAKRQVQNLTAENKELKKKVEPRREEQDVYRSQVSHTSQGREERRLRALSRWKSFKCLMADHTRTIFGPNDEGY